MNRQSALVMSVLARLAMKDTARSRFLLPEESMRAVRKEYEDVEADLRKVGAPFFQYEDHEYRSSWMVLYCPERGLCLAVRGGYGMKHWSKFVDAVLAEAFPSLHKFHKNARSHYTKTQSRHMSTVSQAVFETGRDIPVLAKEDEVVLPPPVVTSLAEQREAAPVPEKVRAEDILQDTDTGKGRFDPLDVLYGDPAAVVPRPARRASTKKPPALPAEKKPAPRRRRDG